MPFCFAHRHGKKRRYLGQRVTWLTQPCTTQEHTVKEIGGSGNGCSFEGGHYESAAYSSM